jgi:integral membrane sensor domain MASE1
MVLLIYALCASTALACSVLLLLGARRSGSRMLFWSGLCFAGLTFTNLLVIADHYLFRQMDLGPLRLGSAVVAIALLLYGLVFEEH